MERLIKENIVYISLVLLILFGGLYGFGKFGYEAYTAYGENTSKTTEFNNANDKLKNLKEAEEKRKRSESERKTASGKEILGIPGAQFTSEASFGLMFESLLSNITNSGVRIRAIDYNYSPNDDKILMASTDGNISGINACELSFITVSNYAQLQTFFKNLIRETYLSNIYEVYIEPYDKDKTILIAKFKIRLYSKLI